MACDVRPHLLKDYFFRSVTTELFHATAKDYIGNVVTIFTTFLFLSHVEYLSWKNCFYFVVICFQDFLRLLGDQRLFNDIPKKFPSPKAKTECQDEFRSLSGCIPKILTACRMLQISISWWQIEAEIHGFPTMYIMGRCSYGQNWPKTWFRPNFRLKTPISVDIDFEHLTSEGSVARNFEISSSLTPSLQNMDIDGPN